MNEHDACLVYLDNCSFNRPWDDQSHIKIRLETEAKLYIQAGIRQGKYRLAWSYMMDFENAHNPYDDKKAAIGLWKNIAAIHSDASPSVLALGREIMSARIKAKDALHIACAILCGCEYFITTDYKLTNKTISGIKIINPIDFIRETEGFS